MIHEQNVYYIMFGRMRNPACVNDLGWILNIKKTHKMGLNGKHELCVKA